MRAKFLALLLCVVFMFSVAGPAQAAKVVHKSTTTQPVGKKHKHRKHGKHRRHRGHHHRKHHHKKKSTTQPTNSGASV